MRKPLLATVLVCAAAAAQDEVKPDTAAQAADKVVAAVAAKDAQALAALAGKNDPDPWLVADELCFRAEHDAAEAFASAVPRNDVEKLPAYVASRRAAPPDTAPRKALAAAIKALAANDANAALAAIEAVDAKGVDVVSVRLGYRHGQALASLRRLKESAGAYLAAAQAAERLGWLRRAGAALQRSAMSAARRSDWRGALAAWEKRLVIEESRPNPAGIATTLGNLGNVHRSLGAYATALEYQDRALEIYRALEDRAGTARVLVSLGVIHTQRGDYPKAIECQEQALALSPPPADRAAILVNLGVIHGRLGAHAKALEFNERGLELAETIGHRQWAANALGNIGDIHRILGDYPKALEYQERALATRKQQGYRAGVAMSLVNIGIIHARLGAWAKALAYQEQALEMHQALGGRAGVAKCLGNLGNIHMHLGALTKALDYQKRALRVKEALRDRAGMALTMGNIGNIHADLGDHEEALGYHARALELMEQLGDRVGVARTLGNIGTSHTALGAHAKALECQKRALILEEELGRSAGVARALSNLGATHGALGNPALALDYWERARAMAAELGFLVTEIRSLRGIAKTQRSLGRPAAAVRAARSGVAKLPLLFGGLEQEQGATARDRWVGLTEHGIRAAMQLGDAAEVSFFLESGRAGALLESLGGREALGKVAVPDELRRAEREARATVLEAQARLGRARKGGKRTEIREARAGLDAAHGRILDAVARIQRAATAAADVAYPRAAPLAEIQGNLAAGDALVSYSLVFGEAMALVVTAGEARLAPLGKTEEIEAAVRSFDLEDPARDPTAAVAALRRLVLTPLGLGGATKRLLVSPAGVLSYVPFALLVPERETVYVPSGTTYGVLLDQRAKRGGKVLALGDPDYRGKRASIYGAKLAPLPSTRVEAKAVGDVVLLGEHATEATLARTIAGAMPLKSVHLACHGLVRADQPQLSALALTPDAENDGFLTVLEVFRMKIPADLVVLSACETAKGKIYRAEGIIGFTRAFMMAGAPRVIVSLWKVDDAATQALMARFYELWKPGKMPTATALKRAQESVRSHEKWKHPYYWAAWQLWGRPD